MGPAYIGAWLNEAGFNNSSEGCLLFVHALEILRANERVVDLMKQIRHAAKLGQYLNQRMQQLRELKNTIRQMNPDGDPPTVEVARLIEGKCGLTPPSPDPNNLKQGEFLLAQLAYRKKLNEKAVEIGIREMSYSIDPETGKVTAQEGKKIGSNVDAPGKYKISVEDVDVQLEKLKSQKDEIDGGRDMATIMFQAALSKKQQIITLISNVIKKTIETQTAVARNI
jgi:hypothetical protein